MNSNVEGYFELVQTGLYKHHAKQDKTKDQEATPVLKKICSELHLQVNCEGTQPHQPILLLQKRQAAFHLRISHSTTHLSSTKPAVVAGCLPQTRQESWQQLCTANKTATMGSFTLKSNHLSPAHRWPQEQQPDFLFLREKTFPNKFCSIINLSVSV